MRAAVPALFALLVAACRSSGTPEQGAGVPVANAQTVGATAAASASGEGAALPTRPGPDSTALRAAADTGRILGAPGAKVWLIMVSDFQCPYCRRWHDQSYEALRREYVAGGRVRAAFLNFPLDQHAQAVPAAEAAMCASAQGKFWPYHSALYATQERWGAMADARQAQQVYDSLAASVGADLGRFRACAASHVMRALVEADRDRMERAGVRSTPSFFVGSRQLAGAQPTDAFRQALDAALAAPAAAGR